MAGMFHPPVEAFGLRSLREQEGERAKGEEGNGSCRKESFTVLLPFPQGTQAKGFYRRMKHPRHKATSPSQHNANSAGTTVTRFETERRF
jgi:hypothetical protein